MNIYEFMEKSFEIAYGNEAVKRDFTFEQVLEKLREYSDNALKWEESQ